MAAIPAVGAAAVRRATGATAGGRAIAASWGRLVGASIAPQTLGWAPLLAAVRQPWQVLAGPAAGFEALSPALAAVSNALGDNGSDPAGGTNGSIIRRGARGPSRNAISGAAPSTSFAQVNAHRLLAATVGGTAGRQRVARHDPAAPADPAASLGPRTVPRANGFAPDGTALPAAGGTHTVPYRHGSSGPVELSVVNRRADATGPIATGPIGTGSIGTGSISTGSISTGPIGTGPIDPERQPVHGTGPRVAPERTRGGADAFTHRGIPVTGAAGSATSVALATERASGGGLGELVQRWNGDGTTDRTPTDHQPAAQRAGVWRYPAPAPGRGTRRPAAAMQDAGEAGGEAPAGGPGWQGAVHDQAGQDHAGHEYSSRDRANWGTSLTSLAPEPVPPAGALTVEDLQDALDDLLRREAQRYGLDGGAL